MIILELGIGGLVLDDRQELVGLGQKFLFHWQETVREGVQLGFSVGVFGRPAIKGKLTRNRTGWALNLRIFVRVGRCRFFRGFSPCLLFRELLFCPG
jgi:hypothetical protein